MNVLQLMALQFKKISQSLNALKSKDKELEEKVTSLETSSVPGPKGADGKSAYEIAKENGYTGTKEEWLQSLKGDTGLQGPPGPSGPQGQQGIQGIPGAEGLQGPRGEMGKPFSISKTFKTKAELEADQTVKEGEMAVVSSDNPDTDEDNGRLYVRTEDGWSFLLDLSGVKGIQGPAGPIGPEGQRGRDGSVGPQGIRGFQGAQGVQGPPGERGSPFNIYRTFRTKEELLADTDVPEGRMAVVASSNPDTDEDNGRLYVRTATGWDFLLDLSGVKGIQGPEGPPGPQGIQGPEGLGIPQKLTLSENVLTLSDGGGSVTLPSQSASSEYEIHGTGMPNGKVAAPVGTTYVDTAATNGALKWIKRTGTDNQGWEVLTGDTGWRTLNISSKLGASYLKVRRKNDTVMYQFGGLSWGWFGIVRRGGPGYSIQPSDRERNVFILGLRGVPEGFRSEFSMIGGIYNDKGTPYGTWYLGGPGDANMLRFQFTDPVPTDKDIGDIRVSPILYLTSEPWPTVLPGS